MKRFIQIICDFAAVCAFATTAVSCDKPAGDDGIDSEFKLRGIEIASNVGSLLKSNAVKIGAAGGQFTVEYDIDGPQMGNVASVSCDADYVTVGRVYQTGFTVTVAANDSGSDRNTKLTLSRSGVKPLNITLLQSKESTSEDVYRNFKIDVSDVTSFSAKFKVTPKDATKSYHYSVVSKANYEYIGGKDAYIARMITETKRYAAVNGAPLSSFLKVNTMEDAQSTYRDNTDYYVVIFDLAFDDKGNAVYSGDAELKAFHTKKTVQSGTTFTLSVTGTKMLVSPSDISTTYVCDVMSEDAWNELTPTDAAWEYIETIKRNTGSLSGYIYNGVKNFDIAASLTEKGKKYVAFVAGYRDDADDKGLSTDVKYELFTY